MTTFKISSELYTEIDLKSKRTESDRVLSEFKFTYPTEDDMMAAVNNVRTTVDKDGDLMVARKHRGIIEIEHLESTYLNLVGLQVWRGALLLADFILHNRNGEFSGCTVLELGSGVGLTSIVAGMYAAQIICTDINVGGILPLIRSNVERNRQLVRSALECRVLELDFKADLSAECVVALQQTDIILAADVIYDDDLTEAFVHTLNKLLQVPPKKVIYIALEKRYVFTVTDLDTSAPCYAYFLSFFTKHKLPSATLESVPIDFPQYFDYDRTKELVLLKLT